MIILSQLMYFSCCCREIMEAMWQPKKYKYSYFFAVLYTYLLTIPDSIAVYWAYGDTLLTRSNAFAVLPPSTMKNVSIIAMIMHQVGFSHTHTSFTFVVNEHMILACTHKCLDVKRCVHIHVYSHTHTCTCMCHAHMNTNECACVCAVCV